MNKAAILLVLILSLLTSCEHKELWYDDSGAYWVKVSYDWSDITDHKLPTAMRVLFYPVGDESRTEPYVFDFSGNEGGLVRLPAGNYKVVSYNHDTDNILLSGAEDINTLTATTQRISPNNRTVNIPDSLLPKEMPLYDSPEWFCRACETNVTILPTADTKVTGSRAGAQAQVVTLTPKWASYKVNLVIKGVRGMQFVDRLEGTITGLAKSLTVNDIKATDGECAAAITATRNETDSVFKASFYVWGLHNDCKQKLNVFIWAQDKNWHTTVDISDELAKFKDSTTHDHDISVDIIFNVEFHHGNGSGFKPTVDDYKEEHHDIPIK